MIEIVIALIIWTWNLTPVWVNVVISVLLFIRFSFRSSITMSKLMNEENFKEVR